MINEETIVSVYNDKMTLLQFLKSVNKALDEAVLTSVEVSKKGNATLSFVFEFADGTKIESGEIVLQQGESVTDAKIVDGHLYLTLSNDERLDAGNVKPVTRFEINASQHLIVYYGDGTNQDLGAIFSGNVNIVGTLNANNITGDSIIETPWPNYSFTKGDTDYQEHLYAGVVKNGNKITFAVFTKYTHTSAKSGLFLGDFFIPGIVGQKLRTYTIGSANNLLASFRCFAQTGQYGAGKDISLVVTKLDNTHIRLSCYELSGLTDGQEYVIRVEVTFLLGDNLVA